jgi:hypothetical protein
MPSLSASYLIPAIFLNPAFVLHAINTFVSHAFPSPSAVSVSPHPFMESIGPLPASKPYLDMHSDENLCWSYTVIMVFVQVLAFGRVQDNRVKRKSAKAAKVERERARKEKLQRMEVQRDMKNANGNGHAIELDAMYDILEEYPNESAPTLANGVVKATNGQSMDHGAKKENTPETDTTEMETSEEEMIL